MSIAGFRPNGRVAHLSLHLPPEWTRDALCAQTDPEAFFPEKGGSTRAAKQVCADCPVRAECLAWALDRGEHFGIWGGKTDRERRRMRRQARRTGTPVTELAAQAAQHRRAAA